MSVQSHSKSPWLERCFLTIKSIRFASCCFCAVLGCLQIGSAIGQSKFMKESEVTEDAMVRALKPAPDAAAGEPAGGLRTRSLSVTTEPSKPKPKIANSKESRENRRAPASSSSARESAGSAPVLLTFEANSSELTPRAKKALDIIAKSLAREELARLKFSIEGHADPRGDPSKNMMLSRERAQAVKTYLVTVHQIDEARLQALGKGAAELAEPKNPAAPENRRVTFVTLQN